MVTTFIKESLNGHQVGFIIGNQTFFLQEVLPEKDYPSDKHAEWFREQLEHALNKL